ncbi:MAG TPA: hypothetical protein VMV72_05395 [Verrucomicrobiae bacterium]|nr:hypothetical protein [Verrucomicrobiae bacterium]
MNAFLSTIKVSVGMLGALLFLTATAAIGSSTNFPGNVTVTSNLVVVGTLTVSNDTDAIKDVFVNGSLSVTNIGPSQPDQSLYLSGSDSDDNGAAGNVVITGGAGDWYYGDYCGGDVLITGGASANGTTAGNVILQGGQSMLGREGSPGSIFLRSAGDIEFQTGEGVPLLALYNDGTLNAHNNYLINVRIVPQGDLSMGSFTNSPPH